MPIEDDINGLVVKTISKTTGTIYVLLSTVMFLSDDPVSAAGIGWAQVGKIISMMSELLGEELSEERRDALQHIGMVVTQEIGYCRREMVGTEVVEKPRTTEGQRRAWAERHQASDRLGQ